MYRPFVLVIGKKEVSLRFIGQKPLNSPFKMTGLSHCQSWLRTHLVNVSKHINCTKSPKMAKFDEAWLRDYQRRQANSPLPVKQPETAEKQPSETIVSSNGQCYPDILFKLSKPLLLPNRKKQMHWAKRSEVVHDLSDEVARAITNAPPGPLGFASIHIMRYSTQQPDQDNLDESRKFLLDVLQPRSKRHPYGLGIIAGDDPAHLKSEIQHVYVKTRAEQKTLVRIRDLSNTI